MNRTRVLAISAGVLAALFAVVLVAALYFSPHWAVSRMRAAVEARDPQALSAYVDFPSLRQSYKAQLLLKMNESMGAPGAAGNPFAALGHVIVTNLINPMVDALVSPEGVMVMLQEGRPQVTPGGLAEQAAAAARPPVPAPSAPSAPSTFRPAPKYTLRYVNVSTAEISTPEAGPQKFILHRHGLFSWKLAAVDMAL